MAPFDGIYLTSYLMACELFAKQDTFENVDLETEGQGQGVQERDLSHSPGNVQLHIGDFFQNFSYLTTRLRKR